MSWTRAAHGLVLMATLASATRTLHGTRWTLKERPESSFIAGKHAKADDVDTLLECDPGETIVQVEMLSVDAFIRTMMDASAYHGVIPIGGLIPAIGYGTVLASSVFKPGTRVLGLMGAQSILKHNAASDPPLMKMLQLPRVKPKEMLGIFGLTTGLTAWVGIFKVARPPRTGEVVVVSAAAGAVGSIAVQLAKDTGARVIGIAGGSIKCLYLHDELGVEAIDYKDTEETVSQQLRKLAPKGVDFFFDSVGGNVLDSLLEQIRPGARIVICGAVSQYSGNLGSGTVAGPSNYLKLAERGASMSGFNVMQYRRFFLRAMLHLWWLRMRSKVWMREHVEAGIERFPEALEKMFTGGHVGKLMVHVS